MSCSYGAMIAHMHSLLAQIGSAGCRANFSTRQMTLFTQCLSATSMPEVQTTPVCHDLTEAAKLWQHKIHPRPRRSGGTDVHGKHCAVHAVALNGCMSGLGAHQQTTKTWLLVCRLQRLQGSTMP